MGAARLLLNPDLCRLPDDAPTGRFFLLGRPERVFELTEEAIAWLGRFRSARDPAGILDEAGTLRPALEAALEEWTALGLLVDPEAAEARRAEERVRLRRPVTPFFGATIESPELALTGAVVLLGAAWDGGTPDALPAGTARAPQALREASALLPLLRDFETGRAIGFVDLDDGARRLQGARVVDAGDLAPAAGTSYLELGSRLAATLRGLRSRGARVLTLGGDHSIALPAISALDAPALGVLQLDAHSDLAPVRFAGDAHHGNVMRHVASLDGVKQIVLVGARGLQIEAPAVGGAAHRTLTPDQLRALDEAALGTLLDPALPWYVSLDIDALDPAVAPGTPVPVAEGLGLRETRRLLRRLLAGRQVVGADLVEVLPNRDATGLTTRAALELTIELLELLSR